VPPKSPFFSVVLTTMDRPALLRGAIDSVLAQSMGEFELIIVDDGAMPADMPELTRDERIVYINKRNVRRGVAASRNIGMELATGHYLCFLDDDDKLDPEFFAWVRAEAGRLPGCALFGNFDMVQERLAGQQRIEISRAFNGIAQMDVGGIRVTNFIPICAIALPRHARLPRFDETLPSHEDWDFLLHCHALFGIVGIDRIACEVRQREVQAGEQRHSSRASYFGLDFLAVYQRHPDRDLAQARMETLQRQGFNLPLTVLENLGRT
jgi:glycosyltransferase involved in cell wall biosynthesis